MKRRYIAVAALAALLGLGLYAASRVWQRSQLHPLPGRELPAGEIAWDGILGESRKPEQKEVLYCLMGSGWLMAPKSPDLDTLIAGWRARNPDSRSYAVATITSKPSATNAEGSKMVWVWVADRRGATLNEYLVRQGACPGETMIMHEAATMPKWLRDVPTIQRSVSDFEYRRFLQTIAAAEKEAVQQRRGIWRKGGEASDWLESR